MRAARAARLFSSFNQSDHCFLASSLPLPSSLLKLPEDDWLSLFPSSSFSMRLASSLMIFSWSLFPTLLFLSFIFQDYGVLCTRLTRQLCEKLWKAPLMKHSFPVIVFVCLSFFTWWWGQRWYWWWCWQWWLWPWTIVMVIMAMMMILNAATLRAVSLDLPRSVGKRKETLRASSTFSDLPLIQRNGCSLDLSNLFFFYLCAWSIATRHQYFLNLQQRDNF